MQVIEKAAAERAQREIDERLQPSYNARIRAKQAGQAYVDSAQLQGRFPGGRLGGCQSGPWAGWGRRKKGGSWPLRSACSH